MKQKLISLIGGVLAGLALVGNADAQDTLRHSQRRNFQEFYEDGRQELPEGTYCADAIFEAGAWSVHPLKIKVQETQYISKKVWEKIECNGRTFYEPKIIIEPQIGEREEIIGYDLHCNKEDALWYKGYEEAKRFKEKACRNIRKSGRVLKEDLRDFGRDVKKGGCRVLEGVGDVVSIPFYIGGDILEDIGDVSRSLGDCFHKHQTHQKYNPKVYEPK